MSEQNRALAKRLKNYEWGNPVNAGYAGTAASLRGADSLHNARYAAITDPEPFPFRLVQDMGNTPTAQDEPSALDKAGSAIIGAAKGGILQADTAGANAVQQQIIDTIEEYGSLFLLAILALILITIGVWSLVK